MFTSTKIGIIVAILYWFTELIAFSTVSTNFKLTEAEKFWMNFVSWGAVEMSFSCVVALEYK